MSDKAVIIMTSGPSEPHRCASPFFLATIGTVMEYDEVALVFTADGTLLVKKGIAETVYPRPGGKSVASFLKDAVESGVVLYACTPSFELHSMTEADLIDGVKVVGGAAVWELLEQAKIVLTF